jgi:hypothetical protein
LVQYSLLQSVPHSHLRLDSANMAMQHPVRCTTSACLYRAPDRVVIHSQAVFLTSWVTYRAYRRCTAATKCDGATSDTRKGALHWASRHTTDHVHKSFQLKIIGKPTVQKHRYLYIVTATCCRIILHNSKMYCDAHA